MAASPSGWSSWTAGWAATSWSSTPSHARVLDRARLADLDEGTLVIDLASKPGGVDFEGAAQLGVKVIWALSLPGKVAPVTSGKIIRDTIYHILGERVQ